MVQRVHRLTDSQAIRLPGNIARVSVRRLLALLTCLLVAPAALADQQGYPFRLIKKNEAGKQVVLAQNSGPAPVSLKLSLTPDGAVVEPPTPVFAVIKPGETAVVAQVRAQAPGKSYRVAMSFKFSVGDPNAVPDPQARYQLPFPAGQEIKVGQIWGGRLSTHQTPESQYAIDFIVPIGTPVLAARAGTVVDIDQRYTIGGKDPALKANHVLILHDDGTLGLYSHFSPNSTKVSFGQRVEAGALIGYSGNTGYSYGPHLHFSVVTNTRTGVGADAYLSHQVKFVNSSTQQELVLTQDEKLVVESP
jgi:murein DD-endopeptidase MepM/ murein hydrolase activator NlpD